MRLSRDCATPPCPVLGLNLVRSLAADFGRSVSSNNSSIDSVSGIISVVVVALVVGVTVVI